MLRSLVFLALCLLFGALARADDAAPAAAPASAAGSETPRLQMLAGPGAAPLGAQPGQARPLVRLGSVVNIRASGSYARKLEAAKPDDIAVVLDDVVVPGLPIGLERSAGSDNIELHVLIARDPNSEPNRKAWDGIFSKHDVTPMTLPLALVIDHDKPALKVQPGLIDFYVAPAWQLHLVEGGALLAFFIAMRQLRNSPTVLRDSPNGSFSLGKTQMAFWGLLVALSFLGLWLLTGTMERISQQVLILLGISAATGLGAVAITNSKADDRAVQLKQDIKAISGGAAPALVSPGLAPATAQAELEGRLARLVNPVVPDVPTSTTWGHFFRDICTEDQGITFHRLQAVIWTAILGLVFVRSVSQIMTMPEFPDTLLVLMGISNGTYLGFKIPARSAV